MSVLSVVKMEKVSNEKCPTARLIKKLCVNKTGDKRHGYELSEEKGPTTANKKFMPAAGDV
jgi:hypothetical protein